MNQVVRTLFTSVVKRLDKKNRTITFVGTKETPDRTGDIVRAGGIELENFGKNSVFLWNHNNSIPAIGKINSVTHEGNALLFDVEFDTPEVDEFADQIFQKFASGFLSAVSIGFIPKDIEPLFSPDGMIMGLDIIRSELLELSAVNIPAHQDALAASMDAKYTKQLTEMGKSQAVQLDEYRKTYIEEEYEMKKLEELEAELATLKTTVEEQAKTIESLITLRETVDLSQKVMDTLNKSVVSLMGEKKLPENNGSDDKGSMPNLLTADPSALLKTLDTVLSRFNEKAFKTTSVGKGE